MEKNLFTNTEVPDISTNVFPIYCPESLCSWKSRFITEPGGEMGSFLPLWMDDGFSPFRTLYPLGKDYQVWKGSCILQHLETLSCDGWFVFCSSLLRHTQEGTLTEWLKNSDTQNLLCKARLYTAVWGISGELCLHKCQELQRRQAAADPASPQLPKVTAALQALPCHLHITQLKTNTPSPVATAAPDTWASIRMAREPLHLELEQGMFPVSGFELVFSCIL